jgi:hypothetical protein
MIINVDIVVPLKCLDDGDGFVGGDGYVDDRYFQISHRTYTFTTSTHVLAHRHAHHI